MLVAACCAGGCAKNQRDPADGLRSKVHSRMSMVFRCLRKTQQHEGRPLGESGQLTRSGLYSPNVPLRYTVTKNPLKRFVLKVPFLVTLGGFFTHFNWKQNHAGIATGRPLIQDGITRITETEKFAVLTTSIPTIREFLIHKVGVLES